MQLLRSHVAAARMIAPTRTTMLASTAHMRAVSTITLQLRRRKLPPNKSTPRRGGLLLLLLLLAAGVEAAVQADEAFFLHVGVYLRGG